LSFPRGEFAAKIKYIEWSPSFVSGAKFVLEIVRYPHPALRYASRPVTEIDDDLRATVRVMFELMYAAKGVGLAANQVALPFRFFILNVTADPEQKETEQVFINPEIVKRHSSVEDEEGCLSLPGLYSKVRRAKKIRVKAYDLEGNLIERDAEDLYGRAIQHETDHLSGKLFIDYLDPLTRHALAPKLREFEVEFLKCQRAGGIGADDELMKQLDVMRRPAAVGINWAAGV
jgi:peptide deformylase